MTVKVAIIYYSATGTTYQLALAVAEGARQTGAEVRFRKVQELAPEEAIASNAAWAAHRRESQDVELASNADLEWADAVIFGTPTRYGLPTAQLKQFLDTTGRLWANGDLVNKICSSFTSKARRTVGRRRPSLTSTPPSTIGARSSSGRATLTPSSSSPAIRTARHSRATMARSSRTRWRSRRRDFRASASPS